MSEDRTTGTTASQSLADSPEHLAQTIRGALWHGQGLGGHNNYRAAEDALGELLALAKNGAEDTEKRGSPSYRLSREAQDFYDRMQVKSERITHGRHCTCSACAREDWTRIDVPCGMHGSRCPASYQPLGAPGSRPPATAQAVAPKDFPCSAPKPERKEAR